MPEKTPPRQLVTPVFCTAEIPTHMLDDLIKKATAVTKFHVPHVLTCATVTQKETPTIPPVEPFTSPFIGKSVEELRDIFDKDIRGEDARVDNMVYFTFVVMDERTLKDQSCLVASIGRDLLVTARCELDVATEVLIPSEVGTYGLNEGPMAEKYFRNGEFFYTKEYRC